MERTAFPRLYVPPEEELELPPVPPAFFYGVRSANGLVTVFSIEEIREIVSFDDWHGDAVAKLASDLLGCSGCPSDGPEECEAFAREVLSQLSSVKWQLTRDDVRKWKSSWYAREQRARWNYPPTLDPDEELPGPADEARMLELVKKIGGKDDERGTVD